MNYRLLHLCLIWMFRCLKFVHRQYLNGLKFSSIFCWVWQEFLDGSKLVQKGRQSVCVCKWIRKFSSTLFSLMRISRWVKISAKKNRGNSENTFKTSLNYPLTFENVSQLPLNFKDSSNCYWTYSNVISSVISSFTIYVNRLDEFIAMLYHP